MLPDVLLALLGFGGNVIKNQSPDFSVENDDGDDANGFIVSDEFPYLQEAEKALLKRLCLMGCQYIRLDTWVRSQQAAFGRAALAGEEQQDGEWGRSVFVPAAAEGVKELLDAYRADVVKCEKRVIEEPSLPLAHLFHALADYEVLFPVLRDLCRTIVVSKCGGAQLLDAVRAASQSGIPSVRKLMLRVIHHCHRAFFRMLESWMVHGHLLDPFGDFFVETGEVKGEDNDIKLWSERYVLKPANIPSYIPSTTAEHVLFVGKAVQLLKHPRAIELAKDGRLSELERDTRVFSDSIHKLAAADELHTLSFEVEIEKMRSVAAKHLLQLVAVDCKLMDHLEALKAYFLLGRGEVWAQFIDETRDFFTSPPSNNRQGEHDLNALFRTSLLKCTFELDTQSERFWLAYAGEDVRADEGHLDPPGWQGVRLSYEVQWPMDLLIGKGAISRYQRLFSLIFRTRRAEVELRETWALLMLSSRRCHATVRSKLMTAWTLRNQMAFMVENLMHYIQEDVIAVQWAKLKSKVVESNDFSDVWRAHDSYLTFLSSLCFLHTKTVTSAIMGALDLCFDFAAVTQRGLASLATRYANVGDAKDGEVVAKAAVSELVVYLADTERLEKDFSRQTKFLLTVLSGVQSRETTHALSQLLLRFDYNDFFSHS